MGRAGAALSCWPPSILVGYAARLLPAVAAFALGLFQDLLTGAPLRSNALILVLTQWILRSQRRYLANRPFLLLWAGFARYCSERAS